ncbi:malto-oligosyltrehalose synthase [Altericroceibacterium xinjiangense]|uniref:malto-oligosyltrehalose synthase n=1 Tax=Altericroceibacterium xinjiangense TaxID=762261 RepID=UPI000F7F4DF4|nr:malto-oligosyltrehalose synthase [Altericroceibacterium xinjiangense]
MTKPANIPGATYRLQFNRDFPFARAEEIVPYLEALGISHIYASPITTARSGSTHGYDVTDPTRVNPELGGEEGLRSLVAALRQRGMGLIIDIVPNHMGVGGGENPWWNDVLQHGEASRYANFFDIDWREKPLVPILGSPLDDVLEDGAVTLDRSGKEPQLVVYGEHRLPIRPEDHASLPAEGDGTALAGLIERQNYRLGWWRTANDQLNWRRFFTVNELAGLRIEDPEVFEASHALYFRLYGEGLIDGLRIDHVDGLTDPAAYCRTLRQRMDAIERPADTPAGPAYIVVEKILGPEERLPRDWSIDGTSGYDFMEDISGLLHDRGGEAPLTALWEEFSGRTLPFEEEELLARQQMLSWAFEGQLAGCVEAFHALALSAPETKGFTPAMLRRAISHMIWVFPVYRTYGTGKAAPDTDRTVREKVRKTARRFTPPGETFVADAVLTWLAGEGRGDAALAAEAVRRFQQLSSPIAAKAVEDTAFYRYGRLLSRNNVGFDPGLFAMSPEAFHERCRDRARYFPHSMLATATHDHKRGEDVRARLAILSVVPEIWRQRVTQWDGAANGADSGVDAADRYMLYQTLFGAWPEELGVDDREGLRDYAERLAAWQEKALREAKVRSTWAEPDTEYETRCRDFLMGLFEPGHREFLTQVTAFVEHTEAARIANSLAQAALRCTVPGVPDTYQGTEMVDFSLVDPDNRRPVDYALREQALRDGSHPKLQLIHDLLTLRQKHPDVFADGTYIPAEIAGPRADNALAFSRVAQGRILRCAVTVHCAPALLGSESSVPEPAWWSDTCITFADGGDNARQDAATLFAQSPVSIAVT